MKVTVKRKDTAVPVVIGTEFIKLEAAMKLSDAVGSGGEAKACIQAGEVTVNGQTCEMRGKKLYPGDRFCFAGTEYLITIHS